MIVKNTKTAKPKAWQIGDLVDYIRFPHNRNPEEKIEYADGRNVLSSTHVVRKWRGSLWGGSRSIATCRCSTGDFPGRKASSPREQVEEVVDMFLEKWDWPGTKPCTACTTIRNFLDASALSHHLSGLAFKKKIV